jgi:hypothetical protein
MVQVALDYMGVIRQMNVRLNATKSEFLSLVKAFLWVSQNLDAKLLGTDAWEIRAGHTYGIRETRQLTLKCKDADSRDFTLKVQGNKDIDEVQEACRRYWGFGPWIKITIARTDGQKFFLQDNAAYTVVATYDASLDPRPLVTLDPGHTTR